MLSKTFQLFENKQKTDFVTPLSRVFFYTETLLCNKCICTLQNVRTVKIDGF